MNTYIYKYKSFFFQEITRDLFEREYEAPYGQVPAGVAVFLVGYTGSHPIQNSSDPHRTGEGFSASKKKVRFLRFDPRAAGRGCNKQYKDAIQAGHGRGGADREGMKGAMRGGRNGH